MTVPSAESTVEEARLEWLGELGDRVAAGAAIAPGEPDAERDGYSEPLLQRRFCMAPSRLNPSLPMEALEDPARKVMFQLPRARRRQAQRVPHDEAASQEPRPPPTRCRGRPSGVTRRALHLARGSLSPSSSARAALVPLVPATTSIGNVPRHKRDCHTIPLLSIEPHSV